jgi:hypothetical protein
MIAILLMKYKFLVRSNKFAEAGKIELKIMQKIENWDFSDRDRIVEEITLASIGG